MTDSRNPNRALLHDVHDGATLDDLLAGRHRLLFECKRCGASQEVDVPGLIRKHGGKTRIAFLKRVLACDRCPG